MCRPKTGEVFMQTTTWIIDDDMVSQFATRYCLEQYGGNLAIETFSNAEEGLAAANTLIKNNQALPKLIFLDLVMDDMDGWQFIDQLKKVAKQSAFPKIYVLSAFVNAKDRATAKKHKQVSGYFDKPLTGISLSRIFGAKTKI
ncbi:response regulator [Croceitalea sp. MTPC5]|nr:response regulator [Croceitalea sp. MTPC5]